MPTVRPVVGGLSIAGALRPTQTLYRKAFPFGSGSPSAGLAHVSPYSPVAHSLRSVW